MPRIRPNDLVRQEDADVVTTLGLVVAYLTYNAQIEMVSEMDHEDTQRANDTLDLVNLQFMLALLQLEVHKDAILNESWYFGGATGRLQIDPRRWQPRMYANGIGGGLRYIDFIIRHASDRTFKQAFRVTRSIFHYVHDVLVEAQELLPPKRRARRDSLTTHQQLGLALCRLGTAGRNTDIANASAYADDTVKKWTLKICYAVCKCFRSVKVQMPDVNESKQLCDLMHVQRAFIGAVGVFDGKHFPLGYTGNYNPNNFLSYKIGGPAVAKAIIADANYVIRYMFPMSPAPLKGVSMPGTGTCCLTPLNL